MSFTRYAALLLVCSSLLLHAELIVYTNPDGYRDDHRIFWEEQGHGVLSFHLFSGDAPVENVRPELLLRLPDSIRLTSWGIISTPHSWQNEPDLIFPAPKPDKDGNLHLVGSPIHKLMKFKSSKWTAPGNYHIYCRVTPLKAGRTLPLQWRIRAGKDEAAGLLFPEILSVEKNLRLPERFEVWGGAGFYSRTQPLDSFRNELQLWRSLGVTRALIYSAAYQHGNTITPEQQTAAKSAGFRFADREILAELFDAIPEKCGIPENEAAMRLDGKRSIKYQDRCKSNALQLCPTAFCAGGGSPRVRKFAARIINLYRTQGVDTFFVDYEKDIYDSCYCPECRKAFIKSEKLNEAVVGKLSNGELIARYYVELYRFRSRQTGQMFDTIRKLVHAQEPAIRIGNNSSLWALDFHTPGIGNGYVHFSEDARFTDFGMDFHDTDMLKGGLEDVVRNDFLLRNVSRPIIARVGAFCDINWNYFCLFSRKAEMKRQNQLFGVFMRPDILKLQIAHIAALGAAGIELSPSPDIMDSLCHRNFRRALDYIARNEKIFRSGQRIHETQVFSDGKLSDTYRELGKRSYFTDWFFYRPVRRFGAVHFIEKKLKKQQGIFLFNYDHFEARPIRLVFSRPMAAVVSIDKRRFQTAKKRELSFMLPASGIASVCLNPMTVQTENLPMLPAEKVTADKQIHPIEWKQTPGQPPYFRNMVETQLQRMSKKMPEAGLIKLIPKN